MFFKSYLPKQYLAAAIVASLLQGVVTAAPVFAEPAAKTEATVTQEATTAQEPMQSKASAASDKRPSLSYTADQNTIDHSAESKPIQNEFLKEGEGIPGTEVPCFRQQNGKRLTNWKKISGYSSGNARSFS